MNIDENYLSQESLSSQASTSRDMPHVDISIPVKPAEVCEVEEAWELELQEADGNKMYLNNHFVKEILHLKGNSIPRCLVPLENIFDSNDVAKEPQLVPSYEDVEELSIGTKEHPKVIKIQRTLSSEAKKNYISLMKEYYDVFAWICKYLKAYDTSFIQHNYP